MKSLLEITEYKSDSNFTGKISLENNGMLFTAISNDNGWKVFVDNKEQDIIPLLDGFIGLDLPKGEHSITFKYTPPGLYLGLSISGISIMALGLSIYLENRKNRKVTI